MHRNKTIVLLQNGDIVDFSTHVLPRTHRLYNYTWSNSIRKIPRNYLSNYYRKEKIPTSKHVLANPQPLGATKNKEGSLDNHIV